jgi:hypothetical protein
MPDPAGGSASHVQAERIVTPCVAICNQQLQAELV